MPAKRLGQKWGVIDRAGRPLVAPRFDEIGAFQEGVAPVRVGVKWGYIDRAGSMVVPPRFDRAAAFADDLAPVEVDRANDRSALCGTDEASCVGKWGYIDRRGTLVIAAQFDAAEGFRDGLARVEVGKAHDQRRECRAAFSLATCTGKYGYINKQGNFVIASQFDRAWDFREGLARVELGKVGFIDVGGKYALPQRFDEAEDFQEGRAAVRVANMWGFIDRQGQWAVPPQFDAVLPFERGLARVVVGSKWGYIDSRGRYVWRPRD